MMTVRIWTGGSARAPLAFAILFLFLSNVVLFGAGVNGAAGRVDGGFDVSTGEAYCLAPTSDQKKAPRHLNHDCIFCLSNTCQPTLKTFVLAGESALFVCPGETSGRARLFRSDPARPPPVWANHWFSRAPPLLA